MAEQSSAEEQIMNLYAQGHWRQILRGFGKNKFLPWLWPDEKNLNFIGKHVRECNANSLVSIGCGSGLLEWLLTMATGIEIIGLEMKGILWTTKYSSGAFIPLVLVEDSTSGQFDFDTTHSVLLFCYFNNLKAFLSYMKSFKGQCLIVMGPAEGRGAYSVPEPFHLPKSVADEWKLVDYQEIGTSKDFIAIYIRI